MAKIKASTKTVVIDRGDEAFRAMVDEMGKGTVVKAGVLASDANKSHGKSTLLDVAIGNEFGTKTKTGKVHIPQRSFIREPIDDHRKRINRLIAVFIKDVNTIADLEIALKKVGTLAVSIIKTRITRKREPKNAPSTIKAKGFDNPLIHTGRLKNSINFEIIKGKGD